MAFNYSPKVVTNGLVLYLDAANTKSYVSGSTTWSDISRSGNNGTLTNGPGYNSANGGSIVFDGANDYFISNNNIGISGSSPRTISCWFNPNNTNIGSQAIFSYGTDTALAIFSVNINTTTSGNIYLYFNTRDYQTGASTITSNSWYNLVITYNSGPIETLGSISLYLNGQNIAITSVGTGNGVLNTSNTKFYIGSNLGTSFFYNGKIGQVSVHNRVLSAQEVLQNYNATRTRFGL